MPESDRCIYAYTMQPSADLLHRSRVDAGLSIRALAKRAHVSPSTISRIESGSMDPTLGMLSRLLESAGQSLSLSSEPLPEIGIHQLWNAWEQGTHSHLIDWTRLKAFIDYTDQNPHEMPRILAHRPPPSGSALLDNLLAGIAETLSDQRGIARPHWATLTPPLGHPWITPGTPRIRDKARSRTPAALSARGITLDRSSLWRERANA